MRSSWLCSVDPNFVWQSADRTVPVRIAFLHDKGKPRDRQSHSAFVGDCWVAMACVGGLVGACVVTTDVGGFVGAWVDTTGVGSFVGVCVATTGMGDVVGAWVVTTGVGSFVGVCVATTGMGDVVGAWVVTTGPCVSALAGITLVSLALF